MNRTSAVNDFACEPGVYPLHRHLEVGHVVEVSTTLLAHRYPSQRQTSGRALHRQHQENSMAAACHDGSGPLIPVDPVDAKKLIVPTGRSGSLLAAQAERSRCSAKDKHKHGNDDNSRQRRRVTEGRPEAVAPSPGTSSSSAGVVQKLLAARPKQMVIVCISTIIDW
jgi:hypothetical protein